MPQMFHNKKQLMEYIEGMEVRVGGDCEEKTCIGITRAMYNYNFLRKGSCSPMIHFINSYFVDHNALVRIH